MKYEFEVYQMQVEDHLFGLPGVKFSKAASGRVILQKMP